MPPIELMSNLERKEGRVLSIQSHVVHGYVGNKVATFAIQSLGLDVDPILSVHFSNHTGYNQKPTGQVLQGEELLKLKQGLEGNGILDSVSYTHVLTGYIGSLSFLEAVLDVLSTLRAKNPNLLYVCDPVLGDHGQLYVPEALVECYKEKVIPHATILTPNQFECELLTGIVIHTRKDAVAATDALHAAGVTTVVITSLEYVDDNGSKKSGAGGGADGATDGATDGAGTSVLTVFASHVVTKGEIPERYELNMPKLEGRFTGTGDLSAALLLSWLHHSNGNIGQAVEKTMGTVQAVLERTIRDGVAIGGAPAEIKLIQSHGDIVNPPTLFKVDRV